MLKLKVHRVIYVTSQIVWHSGTCGATDPGLKIQDGGGSGELHLGFQEELVPLGRDTMPSLQSQWNAAFILPQAAA